MNPLLTKFYFMVNGRVRLVRAVTFGAAMDKAVKLFGETAYPIFR